MSTVSHIDLLKACEQRGLDPVKVMDLMVDLGTGERITTYRLEWESNGKKHVRTEVPHHLALQRVRTEGENSVKVVREQREEVSLNVCNETVLSPVFML